MSKRTRGRKGHGIGQVHIPGADPKAPSAIDPLLFGLKQRAWLVMFLTSWRLPFGEEFGPFFFRDDRVMDV